MQGSADKEKAGTTVLEEHKLQPVPLDLQQELKEGNALVDAGKYEEAIEKLGSVLRDAILVAGNEVDYSLVRYYYDYGDAIIAKLTNSTEIFGDAIQEAISKKGGKVLEGIKKDEDEKGVEEEKHPAQKGNAADSDKEESKEGGRPAGDDEIEDLEIAWETMESARVICEKKRAELDPVLNKPEYKEVTRMTSRIHMGIGEILGMQEREEEALQEFNKALELRLICEDPDSRELAETYYTIGSTILHNRGKEREAIRYLMRSVDILQANMIQTLLCLISPNLRFSTRVTLKN